jgi:Beta-xylosidase
MCASINRTEENDKPPSFSAGNWVPDRMDGTYKNPIVFADYSDPDVVRIGEDFFMIASSFNCTPGIPVLHSKDLINWKIVNHVFENLPFAVYDTPQHGKGVWAPSMKYHDGKLWVFFCTPDEGIFMSCTGDPFGNWAPLHHVKEAFGWIDCCPFWDDDGRAYLLHAFAKSRAGFNNLLELCNMMPDGRKVSGRRIVFNANGRHTVMEGPKLFKRGDYYYITAPAGGIEHGYQVVMRSKNINGPYEDRIVLHEGNGINGPRQGGFVDTPSGEEWFLHFRDMGAYGRVACLEPVSWSMEWPLIGVDLDGDGIGEPVDIYRKPNTGAPQPIQIPQSSDEFDGGTLGRQWQWYANHSDGWCALGCRESCLRLFSASLPESGRLFDYPRMLLQKLPAPVFTATVKLHLSRENSGQAGMIITGTTYAYLAAEIRDRKLVLSQMSGGEDQVAESVIKQIFLNWDCRDAICFRVQFTRDATYTFSYAKDGATFTKIGRRFSSEKELWIGAKVGIFSCNPTAVSGGYADFDWFRIE